MSRYQEAQKIYKEAFGVDTEAALAKLADFNRDYGKIE